MNTVITNEPKFNKKLFEECALAGYPTSTSIIMIVVACTLIDVAYDCYIYGDYVLFICCILTMIISFSMPFYLYRHNGNKNYKNHLILSNGQETTLNVAIYEDYLTYHKFIPVIHDDKISTQSTTATTLTHDKLSKVYNFKENYVMVYAKQVYVPIQKASFTKGSSEEFEEFLLKKGLKLKRKIF